MASFLLYHVCLSYFITMKNFLKKLVNGISFSLYLEREKQNI